MFPETISFPSDSTTAQLVEIIKGKSGKYEYQDGYYFKGTKIIFTEEEIEKMIKKGIIKI